MNVITDMRNDFQLKVQELNQELNEKATESLWKSITNRIDLRNYLVTGLSLVAISMGLSLMRYVVTEGVKYTYKSTYVSITAESSDAEVYDPLATYLNFLMQKEKNRHLKLTSTYVHSVTGENVRELLFIPQEGTYKFKYKGKNVYMNYEQDKNIDFSLGGYPSRITISTYGNNIEFLKEVIDDAQSYTKKLEKGKLVIYTCESGYWKKFGIRDPRPLSSVILDESIRSVIVKDVEEFLSSRSRSWYHRLGIAYRRGYLLYGPPGCGKTSLVKAIASEFGMSICIMSLNDREVNDSNINHMLNSTPVNSIVLLEDIDAAVSNTNRNSEIANFEINSSGLTLGGLLNALDGVASQEGRILFMTTNKEISLDPALIRSGRVDRKVLLGLSTKKQISELFENFHPDNPLLRESFTNGVEANKYSMADLQKYLMFFKHNAEEAILNLKNMDEYLEEISYSSKNPLH